MHVWHVLQAARWKYRTQKWRKKSPSANHRTTLLGYIFATKPCIDNRKKNLLNSNTSSTCIRNTVNFGPLMAEICSPVWGTQQISTGFSVLLWLLQQRRSPEAKQTLRPSRWASAHILISSFFFFSSPNLSCRRLDVYHTSTHGLSVNLGCRSETCYTRLAENTGRKKSPKICLLGTITELGGLYLRN